MLLLKKLDNVVMFESLFDWDDVEWSAVERHHKLDVQGNCLRGLATVLDGQKNIISNINPNHDFTLLGVTDLIVVHTEDATLVCRKDQSQSVKKLVQVLAKNQETNKFT